MLSLGVQRKHKDTELGQDDVELSFCTRPIMNLLCETPLFQSLSQLAQAQMRLDTLRKTLLRALKHKFGTIPIELVQIIEIHPEPERLEQLIGLAFDAPDIDTFQNQRLSLGTLMDQLTESHLFRQLTEEQLLQTRLDTLKNVLLRFLEHKFTSMPMSLTLAMHRITEPECFERLCIFALDTTDIDTFHQQLLQQEVYQREQPILLETKRADLLRVLTRKFGTLAEDLRKAVQALQDPEQLEQLLDIAIDAANLDTFRSHAKLTEQH
jgi:hypothetical protein